MRIHVGYSTLISADELIGWMDVDATHPEGMSVFEQRFGCGYIRPGDFEVYGVEEIPEGFTVEAISLRFPFEVGDLALWSVNLLETKTVFWLKSESDFDTRASGGVDLTDTLEIDGFVYE